MTDVVTATRQLDLQPHPRILPMLGEINLSQWRCLAELLDNSIDSFITSARAGREIRLPEVLFALPTSGRPESRIEVADNGPGMDPVTLENAVRAGWTGNDPVNNLGLFGMGFNIATARLGSLTNVWTTQKGDAEWHGVQIDFDELVRQRTFRTTLLSRPKHDVQQSGTQVVVSKLKNEQREWFSHARNRKLVEKELSRAYSAMLQPEGKPTSLGLRLNEIEIHGRRPCLWDSERVVETTRVGTVAAFRRVDVQLQDRPFCNRCWQWLPSGQHECPSCQVADFVISRRRRILGWLGLQRYLHERDFGIDFLRNGRKIELANKDLFSWNSSDGLEEKEYPIDDPRSRGRIVGEIHIDHCRVTYTKDRFDRADPAWAETIVALRGEGPLRPDKAAELGYKGENQSPLYRLYQAFRRSNPKTKKSPGWAKLLVVPDNDAATRMAEKFYEGDREFESDTRWMELVEEADRKALSEPTTKPISQTTDDFWDNNSHSKDGAPSNNMRLEAQRESPRRVIPSLSIEYFDDLTQRKWRVKAYEVEDADPELHQAAWMFRRPSAAEWLFLVNIRHPVFQSVTLTPVDVLLSELAHAAADSVRDADSPPTYGAILTSMRQRYATASRLDPTALSGMASAALSDMAKSLTKSVEPADAIALFGDLSGSAQDAIWERMSGKAVREPSKVIGAGRFLEFAPGWVLQGFLVQHPALFLDGHHWDEAYESISYDKEDRTAAAREQVVRFYSSLLTDVIWLAESDPSELRDATRARLVRAALALEILESEVAAASGEE